MDKCNGNRSFVVVFSVIIQFVLELQGLPVDINVFSGQLQRFVRVVVVNSTVSRVLSSRESTKPLTIRMEDLEENEDEIMRCSLQSCTSSSSSLESCSLQKASCSDKDGTLIALAIYFMILVDRVSAVV